MALYRNWYPRAYQKQLNFMRRWLSVFRSPAVDSEGRPTGKKKWQEWGIPEDVFTVFADACAGAGDALEAVHRSGLKQGPLHTTARKAFAALEKIARLIKRRFLFCPPLSLVDMEELGLRLPDLVRGAAPVPKFAPQIWAENPEKHAIRLFMLHPENADQNLDAFTMVIRVGILSRDGKIPGMTPFSVWYIDKIPRLAEDLPKVIRCGRKTKDFFFSALESGATAYISVCYENSRGAAGPWSEIIPVIIT